MEQGIRQLLLDMRTNTTFPLPSFNPLNIEFHEMVEAIPKVGDLWVFVAIVSPHHQVRFIFPNIYKLFANGDKVVKLEHIGIESKVLVWRLGRKVDRKWRWNFEHEEKVHYETHQLIVGSYTMFMMIQTRI
jgi:hypothetical protein